MNTLNSPAVISAKVAFFMFVSVQNWIEKNAFGVCTHIGDKLGIAAHKVRMYFIYASFFTFGSPVIIYLVMAFWLDVKKRLFRRHTILR